MFAPDRPPRPDAGLESRSPFPFESGCSRFGFDSLRSVVVLALPLDREVGVVPEGGEEVEERNQ